MAQLPLEEGIPRFKANEERVDVFTNGDENATWTTADGEAVPSIRNYLRQLDTAGEGWVADAEAAATLAADSALAAQTSATFSVNDHMGFFNLTSLTAGGIYVAKTGERWLIGGTSPHFNHPITGQSVTVLTENVTGRAPVTSFGPIDLSGGIEVSPHVTIAVASGLKLRWPRGTYRQHNAVFVGAVAVDWEFDKNAELRGPGHITTPQTPILTYPTALNVGPMIGAAFYFTGLVYYSKFSGGRFREYVWPFAFYTPHNSPLFADIDYSSCNALAFCYFGCQNYTFRRCGGNNCGPQIIAGATAFPAGHPNTGNDSHYCDGLTIDLTQSSTGAANGANTNFDDWFIASILRPTVPSITATGTHTYPYAESDKLCRPSGWALAYVPMRSPRVIFGVTLPFIDMRSSGFYGAACFNSAVSQFEMGQYVYEWNGSAPTQCHFAIGKSTSGGKVESVNQSLSGQPNCPFIAYTGRGPSGLENEIQLMSGDERYISTSSGVTTKMPRPGDKNSLSSGLRVFFSGTQKAITAASDEGITVNMGVAGGFTYGGQGDRQARLAQMSGAFTMPYEASDGYQYTRMFIRLWENFSDGFVKLNVVDLATGDTDQATVRLRFQGSSPMTLTAQLSNGDTSIKLSSYILSAGTILRIAGVDIAIGEVVNGPDGGVSTHYLMNPVRGLPSAQPAGTALTVLTQQTIIRPFRRDWVSLVTGDTGNGVIQLTYSDAVTPFRTTSLTGGRYLVSVVRSYNAEDDAQVYMAAAPTTGRWSRGAIVYNNAPLPSGYTGWICTARGEPGTWKGFGLIQA